MKRRSRLTSDPQKAREWAQRSRGSLSARSRQKEAERATERQIREQVFARDRRCVLAVVDPSHRCRGPLTPHHRRKASSGGAYSMANLITVCAGGNGDIEDRPAYYRHHFPFLVVREGDAEWESLGRRAHRSEQTFE